MTTAAPPEKMSDAITALAEHEGVDGDVTIKAIEIAAALDAAGLPEPKLLCHGPKSLVFVWGTGTSFYLTISADGMAALVTTPERIIAREAARRLAPRVGDDDLPERIRTTTEKLCFEFCEMKPCACAKHLAALSAPPAASAEREELARLIDPRAWEPDHRGAIAAAMQTRRNDTIEKADIIQSAGYRKRAAQGVAEVLGELVRWLEDRKLTDFENPYHAVTTIAAHVRRLSALPKGQEHE